MRCNIVLISLCAGLLAAVASAQDLGAHVGYFGSDLKQAFVGVDLQVPLGPAFFSPNIDYSRKNGIGYWWANIDLDLRYQASGGPAFWFGAGPTYAYFTGYNSGIYGSSTYKKWGWDVNGGLGWRAGTMKPYGTLRYNKISGANVTGAAIGLRF